MALDPAYELRPAAPGDLAAVAAVFAAADTGEAGAVVIDADFLRDDWSRAGFDPARDAWVAIDRDGTVVGYLQTMREEPSVECWGAVHPDHRGRGIGSALLDRGEQRASELMIGLPSPLFRFVIDRGDQGAEELVQRRGLHPVRHFWHMQIDLAGPVAPGAAPPGLEIVEVDPAGDLPAVHAVLDEAFVDHWDYRSEPFERWVEEHVDVARFDPTLWLLAREAGEPVAALTSRVQGDCGWVESLGVRAPWRGRGIGAALLRRSFAAFSRRRLRRVVLGVDAENATGATALYEREGMRVVQRWDVWEREGGGAS